MEMVKRVVEVVVKSGPFKIEEFKPGDMQLWGKYWYIGCPRCGMLLRLEHEIKIENGLITVSPSIGHPSCWLHIFVKNSKIEYLENT